MKMTLLVLSWIILPVAVLNSGILSLAGQGGLALASQDSSNSRISRNRNENAPLAAAVAVVETNNGPVPAVPVVLPTLDDFAASLKNGQAGQVVGVYVPQVLALPVTQQPANQAGYVNEIRGFATQFGLAA